MYRVSSPTRTVTAFPVSSESSSDMLWLRIFSAFSEMLFLRFSSALLARESKLRTLTPEELAGVGLAGEFSLVTDTQYFDQLKGLGFPVGDQVSGKKDLDLSITTFLGLLQMFGTGDHNFEITVTDTKGNATTKTVMLHYN